MLRLTDSLQLANTVNGEHQQLADWLIASTVYWLKKDLHSDMAEKIYRTPWVVFLHVFMKLSELRINVVAITIY